MKRLSLTENLFYNMLYQIIVTVLPIITIPYITRTLGLHANGIYSYTDSIVTYFIVFGSLGTSLYGIRKIAYVRDDKEKLSQVTLEIISLKLVLIVLNLIVFIPLLCVNSQYAYIYQVQILNIIANGIDISWFYQGIEDFKKVTIRNLIVKFAYVIALFVFIKEPDDLIKYILIVVLSALIGNFIMIGSLPNYINIHIRKKLHPFTHLKECIVLFVPQVMNYVYALLDRSMLGWLTNTDNVSIYDQAQRLIRTITAILQSLGYVMMARIANLKAVNDEEGMKYYIHKSLDFTIFLGVPAMFGILGVADDFIPVFLGKEYVAAISTLKLLSILILTMPLNSVLGVQTLIPIGKEKIYTIATSSGAFVNVLVNIFLIPILGIKGACISSLAAEIVVFSISFWNLRDILEINTIIKRNLKVIFAAIIMFFLIRCISSLQINVILKIIFEICGGGFVYFILMLVGKNQILFSILSKIKDISGKNIK